MQLRQRQGVDQDSRVAVSSHSLGASTSSQTSSSADATPHHPTWRRTTPTFLINASLAGACGALSGAVGKLAVESASVPSLVRAGAVRLHLDAQTTERVQAVVPWLLRLVFLGLNAMLTGSMWRFYLKALSQGPTPVCQILNTGTNFVVSAFAGLVFFAEEVTPMWGVGALLIVMGLSLVVSDPQVIV